MRGSKIVGLESDSSCYDFYLESNQTRPALRVLLINPPPFEVVEPWYDTPSFGRHGLACLAGYLREQDGFSLHIIDAKLERLSFAEVTARALEVAPDVVGLTAFTNEIKPAAKVAEAIGAALPGAVIVIGGVHVTALPERTLREFPAFDVGCVGEGEVTFHELCAAIRDRTPLAAVNGIVYRDPSTGGAIRRTTDRAKIQDLDILPLPAWDLLPRADEYWVMTQRGCPFTCKFCVNPNGRLPRQHSVPRVMAEMSNILDRYAPRKLWFADEIFGVNIDYTRGLLQAMIAAGVGKRTTWWAESHVRFVDYALFVQMREAGCVECGLGIESGDEAALKNLGKGTNVQMVVDAFTAAKRAGVGTIGFFIFGHPNESVRSIRATIDLAVRLNPAIPIFGVMVPYPGTEVARLAARGEAGYQLLTDDWGEYNKQVGGALAFAGLSRRQIEMLQLRGYFEVFLRNHRYRELVGFLWRYRVAGVRILAKLLGLRRDPVAENAPATTRIDAASRDDIAVAAETWAAMQVQSVRSLRAGAGEGGSVGVRRLAIVTPPGDGAPTP